MLYLRKDRVDNVVSNAQVDVAVHDGQQFITEDGVYEFIFEAQTKGARKFRKWITHEVLPSIRKASKSLEEITFRGSYGLVYSKDGIAMTTSNDIADKFEMKHENVLRLIDNKLNSKDKRLAQFSANHIKEIDYIDGYGRTQRAYELDEAGFSFIGLGLTGVKADLFKIEYIEMFNKMRQAILNMFKAKTIEAVLPQDNKFRQYLYIIKNPLNENIKIGVAQQVEKRLKQLQTGAGVELELIYKSMICSNAFEIEKLTHKQFEDYRVFGEWFNISELDAISFIQEQEFKLYSEFDKYFSIIK